MIKIVCIEGVPDESAQRSFFQLYETIFGTKPDIAVSARLLEKTDLLLQFAVTDESVVGFKLGYRENETVFYSWLGGVLPAWRGQGIGLALMESQHAWCRQRKYLKVRTKTRNQWRNMLIINIKNGFDIMSTYTGDDGIVRIVLEKLL